MRFFILTTRKLHARRWLKRDRLNRRAAYGSGRSQHSTVRLRLLFGLLLAIFGPASIFLPHNISASVPQGDNRSSSYGPAETIANLQDSSIKESSGLAASRSTPGLYWTHNDSGDGPFIYAFDERGRRRGVWKLRGATARDWEDMATGPGPERNRSYLYIGDIGDNSGSRSEIVVYRVPEPKITRADATSSRAKPVLTEAAESIRLR